jgi:hypothetical protein
MPFGEVARSLRGGEQLIEGRRSTVEEPLPSFGQPDAAGCAEQERGSHARFKRAYRLADGRRRDADLAGRVAEALQPRGGEESLDAFKDADRVEDGPGRRT